MKIHGQTIPAQLPGVYHAGMAVYALAQSLFVSAFISTIFRIVVVKAPMSGVTADAYVWSYVSICSGTGLIVLAEILLKLGRSPVKFFFTTNGNSLHVSLLAWFSLLFVVYPSLIYLLLREAEKGHLRETFEDAFLAVAWVPAGTLVISFMLLAIIYYYRKGYRALKMLPAEES